MIMDLLKSRVIKNFVDDTLLAKWLDTKSAKEEETVSWKRITEYEWYFMKMFSHLDNRLQKTKLETCCFLQYDSWT